MTGIRPDVAIVTENETSELINQNIIAVVQRPTDRVHGQSEEQSTLEIQRFCDVSQWSNTTDSISL